MSNSSCDGPFCTWAGSCEFCRGNVGPKSEDRSSISALDFYFMKAEKKSAAIKEHGQPSHDIEAVYSCFNKPNKLNNIIQQIKAATNVTWSAKWIYFTWMKFSQKCKTIFYRWWDLMKALKSTQACSFLKTVNKCSWGIEKAQKL